MKKILTADHPAQAYFFLGLLQSNGIEACLRNVELFSAQGALPALGACEPEVWLVDVDAEDLAIALLKSAPRIAACWHCPRCGELLEPQFTDCWSCSDSANE